MRKKKVQICFLAALCAALSAGMTPAAAVSMAAPQEAVIGEFPNAEAQGAAGQMTNGRTAGEQTTTEAAANSTAAAGVPSANGGKIRAVTYAGHEWVINFWSTETEYLEEDLRQIKADGFNTIILCVPWRQFQPSVVHSTSFNEASLQKLEEILKAAEEQQLSVMLRLGYTWDYYDSTDILGRYQQLIHDENYRAAWRQYAAKIYETVSKHSSYIGAFLTWEDFWNFVETEKTLAGTYQGKRLAKEMGFTDYVLEHYSREERLLLYGEAQLADAPEFPSPDSPAYRFFFDWYDAWLSELLAETQQVFPNLSMECRLDQDPYQLPETADTGAGGSQIISSASGDGEKIGPGYLNGTENSAADSALKENGAQLAGYSHGRTFSCGAAGYGSLMLSASMGFESGQTVGAEEAAAMSEHLLKQSRVMAQKPVFVDQFLYMETTPGYEHLAGLPEAEIGDYLVKMGEVFNEQTAGYGLWTYRDYADNILYNPEFGMGLDGWTASSSVHIQKHGGSNMAALSAGQSISQKLSGRSYLGSGDVTVSLRAVSSQPVRLSISVGGEVKSVTVNGDETVKLSFSRNDAQSLRITASGSLLLDNIKLYSHVTEGGIYDLDGNAGPYLAAVKACNEKIK